MSRSVFFDGGTLVLDGVGEQDRMEAPFEWHKGRWRCEAIHYHKLSGWFREQQIYDKVPRWKTIDLQIHDDREPHDYQTEALQAWEQAGRRGSIILPTGAGKTFVAIHAIHKVGSSTIIIVPTLELLAQWARVLGNALRTEIGVYYGAEKNIKPLTVTTYHSAGDLIASHGNEFKLIIWDELHHLPSPNWGEAAVMAPSILRLGLTATYPEIENRSDKQWNIEDLVGPVVYRQHIDDLVGSQLANYRTERIRVDLTEEERRQYDADAGVYLGFIRDRELRKTHGAGLLLEMMRLSVFDRQARRAMLAHRRMLRVVNSAQNKRRVLDNLLREYSHEQILIFTESNRVAYDIARQHLIPAISHETKVAERKNILDSFQSGLYHVIVTSKVLNEGVDVPSAKIAVVMGGHSGTREFVQRLGRVLRKVENREAVLFEIIARRTLEESKSQRRNKHAYR